MATSLNLRPLLTAAQRTSALQAGMRVEVATVAWMTVEAVVAIGAGIAARSVLLTAFGIDSIIELLTGGVLLWRLATEVRGGALDQVEQAERRASWIVGIGLAILCLYVVLSAGAGVLLHSAAESSPIGIGLALLALLIMPLLAWRKRDIAARIDSPALRGDAACSITCAYMSATMLLGLVLNAGLGWWWADSLAALSLLYWLLPETRAALASARSGQGGGCCGIEQEQV
ncbi:MAG: cation transporter [Chloroflexota bacterium]|nr:cation transporter [Chloroflexota bacterium]